MRRPWVALSSCLLLMAAACTGSGGDPEAVFRRFVSSWPAGGAALADTITGADSDRLVETLRGIREGGVERATVLRVFPASDDSDELRGTVGLGFPDGGRLDLTVRATVEGDRVLADPAAVSTRLTQWEPLRIEEFGSPARGDVLSQDGTLLAHGPEGDRILARPALGPAVALIDQTLDGRLAPTPGRRLLARDPPQVLAESSPADGEDVRTSIDDRMQAAAERTLGRTPGALVAVDPRTGGIRALVSNPETEAPDVSPATAGYAPGSAFKIVTAAAALEGHVLEPTDVVPCPGRMSLEDREIHNFGNLDYGPITFEKAFAVSCNTAFAQIGLMVGTEGLLRTALRLGFRVVPELDGAATIAVPLSRSELAVWSFGASGTLVSPLQMAGIGTTIARGGVAIPPGWTDANGPGRRVLSIGTTAALVTMMEEVVAEGTGRNAAMAGVRIAGKTGTADARGPGAAPDAWFVGLAPSRDTRVVVIGFLPAAGIGGEAAAPFVRKFLLASAKAWRLH